ncbi:MAG: hypothetical protein ACN4GG_05030 [Akkermansiaceae bacterium]
MNPPNWQNCTEEELWKYVAFHLASHGIDSVLVGGAVVAIYTEGLYQSGDLDLIPNEMFRPKIETVLAKIGFVPSKSRYFMHPKCSHLFLEFPRGPVELGDEYPVTPDIVEHEGRALKILSPTSCVKDRLAGYIYWKSRDYFDQATLVCLRQTSRIDWPAIETWCASERHHEVFKELKQAVSNAKS